MRICIMKCYNETHETYFIQSKIKNHPPVTFKGYIVDRFSALPSALLIVRLNCSTCLNMFVCFVRAKSENNPPVTFAELKDLLTIVSRYFLFLLIAKSGYSGIFYSNTEYVLSN